ncbi:hypothetical protein M8J76_000323 [Diaphorina citri]|nr:hypothetical protein M8J75_013992 [Diaphorina citri]KAI5718780.1 hypothetical protein M8J76_000323 [Diaphorina citri]
MAHDIQKCVRTKDVLSNIDVLFENDVLIEKPIRQGLQENGFVKESPIQMAAFPYVLNGYDAIVQSKSGTGKSIVFVVAALNKLIKLPVQQPQTIILAPTREIAIQITDVVRSVGTHVKNLHVDYFIGGTQVERPKRPVQIVVGSPGRIKQMIKLKYLNMDSVRLFIMDEADKLINTGFVEDITWIYSQLPPMKQMLVVSATYSHDNLATLQKYMVDPLLIRPEDATRPLLGVKQLVALIPECKNPSLRYVDEEKKLVQLLSQTPFNQCVIFSNYQLRPEVICENLANANFGAEYLSGAQDQKARLASLDSFKRGKVRILVTTDLAARGIDAANVDLVINLEIPHDAATYLHRMGRAGRYGTRGLVITIVSAEYLVKFHSLMGEINLDHAFNVGLVPDNLTGDQINWTQRVQTLLAKPLDQAQEREDVGRTAEESSKVENTKPLRGAPSKEVTKKGASKEGTKGNLTDGQSVEESDSENDGKPDENGSQRGSKRSKELKTRGKCVKGAGEDENGDRKASKDEQKRDGANSAGKSLEDKHGKNKTNSFEAVGEIVQNDTETTKENNQTDEVPEENGLVGNPNKAEVGDLNECESCTDSFHMNEHSDENDLGNNTKESQKQKGHKSKKKKDRKRKGNGDKRDPQGNNGDQTEIRDKHSATLDKAEKESVNNVEVESKYERSPSAAKNPDGKESEELYSHTIPNETSNDANKLKPVDFDYINDFVNQTPSETGGRPLVHGPNSVPKIDTPSDDYLVANMKACLTNDSVRVQVLMEKLDHVDASVLADWILNKHNNVAALFRSEDQSNSVRIGDNDGTGNRSITRSKQNSQSGDHTDLKDSNRPNANTDPSTGKNVKDIQSREIKSYASLSMFSPCQTTLNKFDTQYNSSDYQSDSKLYGGRTKRRSRPRKNKENTDILNTLGQDKTSTHGRTPSGGHRTPERRRSDGVRNDTRDERNGAYTGDKGGRNCGHSVNSRKDHSFAGETPRSKGGFDSYLDQSMDSFLDKSCREESFLKRSHMPKRDLVVYDDAFDMFSPAANNLDEYEIDYVEQPVDEKKSRRELSQKLDSDRYRPDSDGDPNRRPSSQESLHHNDSLDIKLRKKLKPGHRLQRNSKKRHSKISTERSNSNSAPREKFSDAKQAANEEENITGGNDENKTPVASEVRNKNKKVKGVKEKNPSIVGDEKRRYWWRSPPGGGPNAARHKVCDDTDFQISWNDPHPPKLTHSTGKSRSKSSYSKQSKRSAENPSCRRMRGQDAFAPGGVATPSFGMNRAYEENFSKLDLSSYHDEHAVFLPNSSSEDDCDGLSHGDEANGLASEDADEYSGSSLNSSCIDLNCDHLENDFSEEEAEEYLEETYVTDEYHECDDERCSHDDCGDLDYQQYEKLRGRQANTPTKTTGDTQGKRGGRVNTRSNDVNSEDKSRVHTSEDRLNFKGWIREMELYNVSTNVNVSDDDGLDESYNMIKTPTPRKRNGASGESSVEREDVGGGKSLRNPLLRRALMNKQNEVNLWHRENQGWNEHTEVQTGLNQGWHQKTQGWNEHSELQNGIDYGRLPIGHQLNHDHRHKHRFNHSSSGGNPNARISNRQRSVVPLDHPFVSNFSNSFNFDTSFSNGISQRFSNGSQPARCFVETRTGKSRLNDVSRCEHQGEFLPSLRKRCDVAHHQVYASSPCLSKHGRIGSNKRTGFQLTSLQVDRHTQMDQYFRNGGPMMKQYLCSTQGLQRFKHHHSFSHSQSEFDPKRLHSRESSHKRNRKANDFNDTCGAVANETFDCEDSKGGSDDENNLMVTLSEAGDSEVDVEGENSPTDEDEDANNSQNDGESTAQNSQSDENSHDGESDSHSVKSNESHFGNSRCQPKTAYQSSSAQSEDGTSYKSISWDAYSVIDEPESYDVSWRTCSSESAAREKNSGQRSRGSGDKAARKSAFLPASQIGLRDGKGDFKSPRKASHSLKDGKRHGNAQSFEAARNSNPYEAPMPGAWQPVLEGTSVFDDAEKSSKPGPKSSRAGPKSSKPGPKSSKPGPKSSKRYPSRSGSSGLNNRTEGNSVSHTWENHSATGTDRRSHQYPAYGSMSRHDLYFDESQLLGNEALGRGVIRGSGGRFASRVSSVGPAYESGLAAEWYQRDRGGHDPARGPEMRSRHDVKRSNQCGRTPRGGRNRLVSSGNETFDIVEDLDGLSLSEGCQRVNGFGRGRKGGNGNGRGNSQRLAPACSHYRENANSSRYLDNRVCGHKDAKSRYQGNQTCGHGNDAKPCFHGNLNETDLTYDRLSSDYDSTFSCGDFFLDSSYENGPAHESEGCSYEHVLRAHPAYYPSLDVPRLKAVLERQREFMESYASQMSVYLNVARNIAGHSYFDF